MTEKATFSFGTDHLMVQTDPTITFSNGMKLWLAEKGETVEINQYDWDCILQADMYIREIGKYRFSPASKQVVVATPVKQEKGLMERFADWLIGRSL